jgi:hypothetical protein
MNTNRIVDTDPLEDIDNDDDLLFTNNFVSSVSRHETTDVQKQDFRRYYEDKQKKLKNKKIIELVDEDDVYDGFTNINFKNKGDSVVTKKTQKIIKTENASVISIDSQNRNTNKYRDANSFKIDLGKSFYNVKTIKLISSSIPNTDQVIKETPIQIRNNLISWQNLEDQYIGIYTGCACSTTVSNTVDLVVAGHGLETQEYIDPLTIRISNSNTTPSVDGEWNVTVVDSQTLRIPFYGGVTVAGVATIDTGFPTYTVAITPGNYSIITLSEEAQRKMNLVKRLKGTGAFHYFTVESNLDTDITTFRSYITKELELDSISTEISSTDIHVQSEQHGFKDGDYVLMIGITSLGGLSSIILNGLFVVKEATRSSFKYEVNQKATFSADGGGNSVKTGKPTEFRFLFDTADTKIVYNIGFPDEDSGVFINTTTETPLDIYTKSVTSVSAIGDYVEFTSISHGLEECNVVQINSISSGASPVLFLDSPHGLQGSNNIFIYYPHSTPSLGGFHNVTVNGSSTLLVDSFTVTTPGSGLGEVKIGGDCIKLLNFKSIPTITARQFPIEDVSADTFRIHVHEGLVSVVDEVLDTVVQTNNLYVNHPNHGFNELSSIHELPFLQSTWGKSITEGQKMLSITRGSGLFVSAGRSSGINEYYRILRSIDGSTWTTSYSSLRLTIGQLNSVCYAPSVAVLGNSSLYVTVGSLNPSNNLVLISSNPITDDGITSPWTLVNIPFGGEWESVCWSQELQLFVACGYVSNTENIMISSNGTNWTLITNPTGLYNEVYKSVTWSSELGLFVAIGYDITLISSDGTNWTIANNYPDDYWESITWSSELGLFVAVASRLFTTTESKYVMTSANGYDWTQRDTPIGGFFLSVVWSPRLSIFLAVGSGNGTNPIDSMFGSGSTTPNTLVLNFSSSSENDFYKNWDITITSGLGSDQTRRIKTYDGITKIAIIYVTADNTGGFIAGNDLVTAPSLGDNYTLYPASSESMMTSRDGITWISRKYQPASILTEVCWASDLEMFVSTAIDYGSDPDDYRFLISNITYGDIYCETVAPHSYTGTRYNDADLVASTVVTGNVDIDIPSHGLVTNDKIIVADSTTTPSINGSYFIEVIDSDTVRIPFVISSSGTCKVRHGDSVIFTGTNSIPSIDGIEATVIGVSLNDPTYMEISIGRTITVPGTTGIIGRRNITSLHRVGPSEPGGDYFVGVPLEIINNTYHKVYKIIDENNYIIKLGEFATSTYSGGGSGITVSSERNGSRVFQSNTFTFEETGVIFRAIFLSGENYIFLTSPGLDTVYNPGNKKVGDIFAKILLKEQPGALVFDSFISAPKIFNPPIATIKELQFEMKRKDGYLFNFNNMNYSISIEIVEIVDQIHDTGLSGRTGTSDLY